MKKKLLTILLATMLFTVSCGSAEAPAEPSKSVEASAAVQEEKKETEPVERAKKSEAAVKPEATATPKPTEVPKATEQPKAETTPDPTIAPAASTAPEATQAPVATEKPEESTKPEATVKPEETEKPKATEKPKTEATPKPTEKPKAEATPEPTPEPVHTCSWDGGSTTREATCNSDGEITYSCSCGKTKTESISKTSHNYVSQTTEATCTSDGSTAEVCTNCGDTKGGSTIGALGHDYEKNYPMGDNTDCRGGSYYVIECSRCGDVSDSGHDEALPCDFEEREKFAGDCRTPSVVELTCKNCGFSKTEEGSTTDDHDWITVQEADTFDIETNQIIPGNKITVCSRCSAAP